MSRWIRQALPRPLLSRLRSFSQRLERKRYGRRIQEFSNRDVRHRYGNLELTVHIADPQGELWYDHDWNANDLGELDLLARGQLRAGARVFDLGCHQGVVACMLAEHVGVEGEVIAVDPHPHNATLARKNAELNGCEGIHVVQGAVGEHRGRLRFNHRLNTTAMERDEGGYYAYEVDAWSVDDLAHEYGAPDVLFIDVEGFEVKALRGATETLSRKPDVFVEVHTGCGLEEAGGSVEEVVAFFAPNDYELFVASERERVYRPFDESTLPSDRFFLVGIANRDLGSAPHGVA